MQVAQAFQPFRGETAAQMTTPARLHQALSENRPIDTVLADDKVLLDTVKGFLKASRLAPDLKATQARVQTLGLMRAKWGAVIGAVAGALIAPTVALAAVPCAVTAAAALAALGYLSLRLQLKKHDEGDVTVVHNGHETTTRWTGNPQHLEATSARILAEMEHKGLLGEGIAQATVGSIAASPEQLSALDPYIGQLQMLDGERRLVADLGQRSDYGHDVLSQVDADTARRLLATGGTVYVVNGGDVHDTQDAYKFQAQSKDGELSVKDRFVGLHRTFRYDVTPIESPTALAGVPAANGLPEAFAGIYKHASETTLPVLSQTSQNKREQQWDQQTYSHQATQIARPGVEVPPLDTAADELEAVMERFNRSRMGPVEPKARIYGHVGACAAGLLSSGVGIYATMAGLVAGPVAACAIIASVVLGTYVGGCVGSMREGQKA